MPSTTIQRGTPITERVTDTARIAHLLRRAGFGATGEDLSQYARLGYEGAVDALLNWEYAPEMPDPSGQIPDLDVNRLIGIQTLWLYRMANSPRPLQEKMTLFWHGHFATANAKVNNTAYMWNQNELFRTKGMGNFRTLVHDVAKDPAMMRWLDTITSKRARPNENFARELFELFTLGIGNYTEQDIREAARAFTGWEIRDDSYFFNRNQFDPGSKTVFGRTGNFTGEQIVDLAVDHPASARFIVTKLYRFFVDDRPQPATIERLAAIFASTGYEIRPLLRAIFLSQEFLHERAYHAKIKSPVDFVVGAVRQLGIPAGQQLVGVMSQLGQALFNPPTVKGWPDSVEWISASTLLQRANFTNQLVTGRNPQRQPWIQPAELLDQLQLTDPEEAVDYLLSWLVGGDASPGLRSELVRYLSTGNRRPGRRGWDGKVRAVMHLIMASPVYQFA